MANVIDVQARFSASVDDAVRNIDRLGKSVDSMGGATQKASGGFLSSIGKMAKFSFIGFTAISGAVGGVVAGINKLSQMSQSAESHQFRLAQLLKVTGGATEEQIKGLNEQAKALAKVGTATAENITQVQSQLATFDLTANTIHRLTPAILDYVIAEKGAAATTDDFKSMTNGLAQALNGNFGSLAAVGFVLDDATKKQIKYGTEQERSKALVEVLNSTYEGFNEAIRNTPQGQMRALKQEIGEVAQEIGKNLTPVMGAFLGFVSTKGMPLLKSLSEAIGAAFKTGDIGPLLEWLKTAVSETFQFIYDKVVTLGPKVLAGVVNMFAAGGQWIATEGVPLFQKAIDKISEFVTGWLMPRLPKFIADAQRVFDRVRTWLVTDGVRMVVNAVVKLGDALFGWVLPRIPMFLDQLKTFAKKMVTWATDVALPALLTQVKKLGDALVEWIEPAARDLPAQLVKWLAEMANWLLQVALPKLLEMGVKLGKALIGWVFDLAPDLIIGIGKALLALVKALPGLLASIAGALIGIGKALGELIIKGLQELLVLGAKAAVGFVNLLIDAFNKIPLIPNIPKINLDLDKLRGSMGLTAEQTATVNAEMKKTQSLRTYGSEMEGLGKKVEGTNAALVDFSGLFADEEETGGGGGGAKGKPNKAADKAAKRLEALSKMMDTVVKSSLDFGDRVGGAINLAMGEKTIYTLANAEEKFKHFNDKLATTKTVTPEVVKQFDSMTDAISKQLVGALDAAKDALESAKKRMAEFKKEITDTVAKAFGSLSSAADLATTATKNQADAQKDLLDAKKKLADANMNEAEANERLSELQSDPDASGKSLTAAYDDLVKARAETAEAANALAAAEKNLEVASKEAAKSFVTRLREQAEAGKTFTDQIKTLIQMGLSEEALQQVLAAGVEAGGKIADELIKGGTTAIDETNKLIESAQAAAAAVGELAAEKWYAAGVDHAQQQIDGLIAQVGVLTPQVMTAMDELAKKMRRQAKIDIKISQKEFNVDVFVTKHIREIVTRQTVNVGDVDGKRAAGGPVRAGGTYLVGERGPELFTPNSSGSIVPNGGFGGSVVINVNAGMGADGGDIGDKIVEALKRYQRRNGSVPITVS